MDVRKAIAKAGAVLEGEYFFALKKKPGTSCKYINMDPIYTDPDLVEVLGALLIEPWVDYVDTIAVPAVGAIPLAYAAARACKRRGRLVSTIWADKLASGGFAFERMGFVGHLPGQRVAVLEDIVSTGSSGQAVCELVERGGGTLLGASFIWNRGNVQAQDMGVRELHALVNEPVQTYPAGTHEMWGKWPLVEDIGHPEYYPDYPGSRIKLLG